MLHLSHLTGSIKGKIQIGGSKSETNRLLILQALSKNAFEIKNSSKSQDSEILQAALNSNQEIIDCGMAGTAFRFLTAYFAQKQGSNVILTGSKRMLHRPISPLVAALQSMGADIIYVGEKGFPPIKIVGQNLTADSVEIDAGISSQFITALMLIAPFLPYGLVIKMKGYAVSMPYLYLTSSIMQHLGFNVMVTFGQIQVLPGMPTRKSVQVEPDWSSASYLFAMAFLANKAEVYLPALRYPSMQGDSTIVGYLEALGIEPVFIGSGYRVSKPKDFTKPTLPLYFNLQGTPDLAQTLAVLLAALDIPAQIEGLSTLRIKETDRIHALENELKKLGAELNCGADFIVIKKGINLMQNNIPQIKTYDDHRMAMAFAPLALLFPVYIENPGVVAKSYPNFWSDLNLLGFNTKFVDS